MKKIDAIVKTSRLEDVVNRLRLIGVTGMTLAEVFGFSRDAGTGRVRPGERARASSAPRYQLTVVVPDEDAAHVMNAIAVAGRSEAGGDGVGDGFVVVSDIIDAMRIRTGETGTDAL